MNPVVVGSRIRNRIMLSKVEKRNDEKIFLKTIHTVEIEGQKEPACVAEKISLIFV